MLLIAKGFSGGDGIRVLSLSLPFVMCLRCSQYLGNEQKTYQLPDKLPDVRKSFRINSHDHSTSENVLEKEFQFDDSCSFFCNAEFER
jgi:hypothetical protein